MRFSVCIVAVVCAIACEAAIRFTEPVWRPDLGISVPCLQDATADPLPLPRAQAYLVTEERRSRLEDRYDTFDLWTECSLRGRWRDAEGNVLYLARLSACVPNDAPGTVCIRRTFYSNLAPMAVKDVDARNLAVQHLSPVETGDPVRSRRAQRQNLKDLWFYPTTNDHALVCAFRPRSPERSEEPAWYLAALIAAPDADMDEVRARFDGDFLDRIARPTFRSRPSPAVPEFPPAKADENALLRWDMRASVANYDEWACSQADDVLVLDDLTPFQRTTLVGELTNALPRYRRAYARCVPSPLTATNQTALVRVFREREDYLAYVGVEQKWTAALWSPLHRELVLYHPQKGNDELLKTVWHEAFHQYLSYAGSMISASPWFNEGHAELFGHSHLGLDGTVVFERDLEAVTYLRTYATDLAEILPDVLMMDYDDFYAGTSEDIQAKYRLAWSVAYFLEVGAPKLRFRPYERLRADYMQALIRTKSMHEATQAVFSATPREKFVAAWLDFWKQQ